MLIFQQPPTDKVRFDVRACIQKYSIILQYEINRLSNFTHVHRLVNSHYFKKVQKTCTRDFERNNNLSIKSPIEIPVPTQFTYSRFSFFPRILILGQSNILMYKQRPLYIMVNVELFYSVHKQDSFSMMVRGSVEQY